MILQMELFLNFIFILFIASELKLNWFLYIVSPLPTNLIVANFQRCECALVPARNQNLCHQRHAWVKLQLALSFLLLMILQLYHIPPPLPPPVSNSSCLFTQCQPLYASCCILPLYFSRYCTVRLKMFYFLYLFFMYYLCKKYYKPITVQYYIADFVSWVPRFTSLDLRTNWTHKCILGMELVHMFRTYYISLAFCWTCFLALIVFL